MTRTNEEILREKTKGWSLFPTASIEEREALYFCIQDAMDEFAEQEAKSFANWLSYQKVGRKTIDQLWNEYQELIRENKNDGIQSR